MEPMMTTMPSPRRTARARRAAIYEPHNVLGPSQFEIKDDRPIQVMDGSRIAGDMTSDI